ncbi:hypothetical protein AVKW3434_07535 [Acidovorax sp. SUPP3434]|uniref:hypothetical protein n=1 Tax=Acidovorax sp. SUPP3434 TaxID=2920880 RepID=UPI0023DE2276|nr:hypothetical protein [Acidovorax sp. SUPP3434]GKS99217.1 hypothetical protein AVKW3434_07535 [Acidovorax sp. SUPP3434]
MNPASRINAVTEAFLPLAHGEQQVVGWNKWLSSNGASVSEDTVMLALRGIRKEIKILESRLKNLGVPEELFKDTLHGLNQAFQSAYLHRHWGDIHSKVTAADVRANLAWMGWVLNKLDENDIDESAMTALLQAIAEQDAFLKENELPDGLRELLESQIEELRIALMLYRVNGVQPIVDAVNKQSGEMRNASKELVAETTAAGPEAQGAVTRGMELISKAAKVADSGLKVVKFGKELYELGASGYAMFGQLLLSSPASGS